MITTEQLDEYNYNYINSRKKRLLTQNENLLHTEISFYFDGTDFINKGNFMQQGMFPFFVNGDCQPMTIAVCIHSKDLRKGRSKQSFWVKYLTTVR